MGKKALSGRENWQTESGPGGLAGTAERNLYVAFKKAFEGTEYIISNHPTNFKHLYDNVVLDNETLAQIYNPDETTMLRSRKRGWGVLPDFSITNTKTGKILFGEIKRQDGWIEGGKPSDGRGNVHALVYRLSWASYFSSLKLHCLQNNAKWSK